MSDTPTPTIPGSETQRVATQHSWKTVPMPAQRHQLRLEARYTPGEYARIKLGVIPRQIEDKWVVFHEGNTLYFHRSWTGYCIYEVKFSEAASEALITGAYVNRDPDQYRNADDGYDASLVIWLIGRVLLGRTEPLPQQIE